MPVNGGMHYEPRPRLYFCSVLFYFLYTNVNQDPLSFFIVMKNTNISLYPSHHCGWVAQNKLPTLLIWPLLMLLLVIFVGI